MDREKARQRLADMVSASTPPALSDADLNAALDAARIVDPDGRAPISPGYVETFDLNYAAGVAFETKADRALATDTGDLESFTSEGSAFKRRAGTGYDGFMALAAKYKGRSTAAQTGGSISVIEVGSRHTGWPRSAVEVVTNAD